MYSFLSNTYNTFALNSLNKTVYAFSVAKLSDVMDLDEVRVIEINRVIVTDVMKL